MNHTANQRNEQVLAYLDLVTPIAWHYSRASGQDHDDLTQVGRLGLLKAAQQYNTGGENTFRGMRKRTFAEQSFTTCATTQAWCDCREHCRNKRNA